MTKGISTHKRLNLEEGREDLTLINEVILLLWNMHSNFWLKIAFVTLSEYRFFGVFFFSFLSFY